jgi:pfkB family carbohydrate kinase
VQAGARVIFDLSSWEIVRRFRSAILGAIGRGLVWAVFGNADEAYELACEVATAARSSPRSLANRAANGAAPGAVDSVAHIVERAQELAIRHCEACVITMGARGCSLMTSAGERTRIPALSVPSGAVKDATGAGDLFAAGVVGGLLKGCDWEACCCMGCVAGAAAVQVCHGRSACRAAGRSDAAGLPRLGGSLRCLNTAVIAWGHNVPCASLPSARLHGLQRPYAAHGEAASCACSLQFGTRTQVVGAELPREMWEWVHQHMADAQAALN